MKFLAKCFRPAAPRLPFFAVALRKRVTRRLLLTESAFARFRGWGSIQLMLRHSFSASLLLVGLFVFSPTLSAQTSSIEGNVVGADGRPLRVCLAS
jgi:hypothetical protein